MKKILFCLAALICLLVAAQNWNFLVGVRVFFYDILLCLFIFFALILFLNTRQKLEIPKKIREFLLLQWIWVLLAALSGFFVVFFPIENTAALQFLKGIILLVIHTLFASLFAIFLVTLSQKNRDLLVRFFIWGVVLSSLFGLAQLVSIKWFGIDIDTYIWPVLSFNKAIPASLGKWQFQAIYRTSGLTQDPNVQASYILTALPLLLLFGLSKNGKLYLIAAIIAIFAFFLTMSRSGFLGLFFSLIVIFVFFIHAKKINLKKLLIFLAILAIASAIFFGTINEIVIARLGQDTSVLLHLSLIKDSVEIASKRPFGYGFNNFALAYDYFFSIPGNNAHSSWATYLVETGIIGFLFQLIFFFFVCHACLNRKTLFSKAFLAAFIGVSVAAIFYETLNLFYFQFFVTLFFCHMVLEKPAKTT